MSEFADIKQHFLADVVANGWRESSSVRGYENVPPHLIARWCRQLYGGEMPPLNGRFINHFLVGADPEFMMVDPRTGEEAHAETIGLRQGLAFGEDNSGRQVELRPVPSRSALEVTASIWAELRWLNNLVEMASLFHWHSGAFHGKDGLGGHVHFGRQRPTQEREILALDTLAHWLFETGVFDKKAGMLRLRHTNYGRLGDVRSQHYGYEYRTLPSFLETPAQAFLTLTLAKLAVVRPEFFPMLTPASDSERAGLYERRIAAILAYFRGLDDDAALAFEMLRRHGIPRTHVEHFAPKWGIRERQKGPSVQFIPRAIEAHPEEVRELQQALLAGRVPTANYYPPPWQHVLGPDYVQALRHTSTRHAPGYGEFLANLVTSARPKVEFMYGTDHYPWVSSGLAAVLPAGWQAQFPSWKVVEDKHLYLGLPSRTLAKSVNTDYSLNQLHADVVDSGVFPIWERDKLVPESLTLWKNQKLEPPVKKPLRDSVVVYGGG